MIARLIALVWTAPPIELALRDVARALRCLPLVALVLLGCAEPGNVILDAAPAADVHTLRSFEAGGSVDEAGGAVSLRVDGSSSPLVYLSIPAGAVSTRYHVRIAVTELGAGAYEVQLEPERLVLGRVAELRLAVPEGGWVERDGERVEGLALPGAVVVEVDRLDVVVVVAAP